MIPFKKIQTQLGLSIALIQTAILFLACEPPAKKRNPTDIKIVSNNELVTDSLSHFDTLVNQAMQEAKEVEVSVYRINEFEKIKKQKQALLANQRKKSGFKTGPVPTL